MKINIKYFLAATLPGILLITLGCEKNNPDDQPGDPVDIFTEVYQKEVIDSANRFAFDLFRPIITESKGSENIMISPFSITSALSMTLNGAAGETCEAMKKTLRLENKTLREINETYLKLMTEMVPVDERVILEIANSVWIEKKFPVKQTFKSALREYYMAEAREIDINNPDAVNIVNDWIAEKTHDKITEMLDGLDPALTMLLVNAIYFNGKWRYRFDENDTGDEPFYITPASPKDVPMMHQKENLDVTSIDNATLVELPYGQGNYSMVLLLPDENITTADLVDILTAELWLEWMDRLNGNTHEVDLSLPRFKYKYKRILNSDLYNMGMGIAFTDQADFSNISDVPSWINRVIHESFIETNEEGTEAAAVTVVEFINTSVPETITVNVNRPFLYFIREISTGTILFMGRVSDPTVN
ncbi:MAG TPA: serpin family protein [Bacteroidetes bacterium]|nr:serpin family protein [Bacteroidota bacterium]